MHRAHRIPLVKIPHASNKRSASTRLMAMTGRAGIRLELVPRIESLMSNLDMHHEVVSTRQ